eukprot:185065-Amphidinium_carterae.2
MVGNCACHGQSLSTQALSSAGFALCIIALLYNRSYEGFTALLLALRKCHSEASSRELVAFKTQSSDNGLHTLVPTCWCCHAFS